MSPSPATLLALLLAPACAADEPAAVASELAARFGLDPEPARAGVVGLAWSAPACPQVYRVRVDETYPPGLERALRSEPEHSDSYLALAPERGVSTWSKDPVLEDRVFTGRSVFRGPRTRERALTRELALSSALIGPASPDAPCFERTWDPVEDALALGWPQVPGRLVAVGESWRGARVEARCNRSACVDPQTRGGGPDNHSRPCTTMSWRERLDGVVRVGEQQVAEISSFWSDGHPLGEALWSERTALVSVDHGRLIHSVTTIHHGYTGIEREVRIEAVDGCPGGPVELGWSPDPAIVAARDGLLAALDEPARRADKSPGEGR